MSVLSHDGIYVCQANKEGGLILIPLFFLSLIDNITKRTHNRERKVNSMVKSNDSHVIWGDHCPEIPAHWNIYIAYLFIYRQLRRREDITFCLHTVLKYRGHNLWFTNSLDNKSKVMPPQEEFKLWSSQVTYVKTNYLCILQNTWWLQSETDLIWSMSTYCVEFVRILYHSPPKISHLQHICSLYCSGFLE